MTELLAEIYEIKEPNGIIDKIQCFLEKKGFIELSVMQVPLKEQKRWVKENAKGKKLEVIYRVVE